MFYRVQLIQLHQYRKILSQLGNDRLLHLVAYFLKKIAPTKCNYEIYNKKNADNNLLF